MANSINGWISGIDVLYLCNKRRCENCPSRGIVSPNDDIICRHTSDVKYSISTHGLFEYVTDVKCIVQKEIG